MKLFALACFCLVNLFSFAQVGIGTPTPATSAQLDVNSSEKGFLPPRMTTQQRDAIASPVAGLVIYNSTTNELEFYNGEYWTSSTQIAAGVTPLKKLYGSNGGDYIYDMRPTPDGGFVTAGFAVNNTSGSIAGAPGMMGADDCWVMKFDAKGSLQWQKIYGGNFPDYGTSIVPTADGGYAIAGYTQSSNIGTFAGAINNGNTDVFLIKTDAEGNVQWKKFYGGSQNEFCYRISAAADGYLLAGSSNSGNSGTLTGLFNYGATDGYVIKTDLSGNISWQKLLGGTNNDQVNCIQVCNDNTLILGGNSYSSNTGSLLGVPNNGDKDGFIAKLSSTGSLIWQKLMGGTLGDEVSFVMETFDGFFFAGGASSSNTGSLTGYPNNGGIDGWVGKLDVNGNLIWQRLVGGINNDFLTSVAGHVSLGLVALGYSASSNSGTIPYANHGNTDLYIVRLDGFGNILWQRLMGGNSNEYGVSIFLHNLNLLVAGYSSSSDNGNLSGLFSYGNYDGWILKMDMFGVMY